MATSPSSVSSSHLPRSRPGSINDRGPSPPTGDAPAEPPRNADDVPVEVLVEHLLAAKRSLSSITLVLRANELVTRARQLHEEAVILSAQTAFLQRGIHEQVRVLLRLRRGMGRAYDAGKKEFRSLLRTLDAADNRLQSTMDRLRETPVEKIFRPEGEEPKTLIDFVDEKSVDSLRDALKASVAELQAAQTSFDGDLLRFDDDLRALNKAMSVSPSSPSPTGSEAYQSIPHLLASLTAHSHAMAEHLSSLTRHFDMCVTAVRTTEGGAALALRKAAEGSPSQAGGTRGGGVEDDPVSISGVMAERDAHVAELEEPLSAEERAEIVQVVVQDAPEVDEVVAELGAVLQHVESDFAALQARAERVRASHAAAVSAFRALEEVGARLRGYAAAEAEFAERRAAEREVVAATLEQVDELRRFYERYEGAYESLILEAERRRAVEDKIEAIWRKARESVRKLVEADREERELFRQEIGEFLPTDLWVGMNVPLQRWEVVPVDDEAEGLDLEEDRVGSGAGRDVVGPAKGKTSVLEPATERTRKTR